MSGEESMEAFIKGFQIMIVPALIVGFVRGIQVVLHEALVIDTIISCGIYTAENAPYDCC